MKNKMKKVIGVCLSVVMTCSLVISGNAYGAETVSPSENKNGIYTITEDESNLPELVGQSAIVVDMETGYTLYEKDIYTTRYPASITKIMTALLTMEQAAMEEVVTFSYGAVYSVEAGSSVAYVDVDEQLTVEQCLYGLLLISGNDLANGLAEHVGGSMDSFAKMMTNKAKALGCINTNFTNAHGLHDENHYTCAYDMAVIAMNAYESQESFRKICSTLTYECAPTNLQTETRVWGNNNRLINPYEELYYPDCIGGKTGYTNEAGGTLVTFANINGRELVCVIMKSTNSASAFADTTALYDYVKKYVTDDMYAALDAKYNESINVSDNSSEENATDSEANQSTMSDENAVDTAKQTDADDDGMWIGWKILLLAVTLFVIYYVYIRYMRYQKIKQRREKRMRQRRDRERD